MDSAFSTRPRAAWSKLDSAGFFTCFERQGQRAENTMDFPETSFFESSRLRVPPLFLLGTSALQNTQLKKPTHSRPPPQTPPPSPLTPNRRRNKKDPRRAPSCVGAMTSKDEVIKVRVLERFLIRGHGPPPPSSVSSGFRVLFGD